MSIPVLLQQYLQVGLSSVEKAALDIKKWRARIQLPADKSISFSILSDDKRTVPFPSWEILQTPAGIHRRLDCGWANTWDSLHKAYGMAHKPLSQSARIDHNIINITRTNIDTNHSQLLLQKQ